MADSLKEIRIRLDAVKTQRAKDEGALEQSMKRLRDEHGCKTLDAARAMYAKRKAEVEKNTARFDAQLEQLDAELTAMEQAVAGR